MRRMAISISRSLIETTLISTAVNLDESCVLPDVNECAANNGGCSQMAQCSNTPGSFSCLCKVGYTGNGFNCSGNV